MAEPPLTMALDAGEPDEIFLLLDGLDELVGALHAGTQRAIQAIRAALDAIPLNTRVVLSCRTPIHQLLEHNLEQQLSATPAASCPLFDADRAIERTVHGERASISTYTLLPVQAAEARAFLEIETLEVPGPFLERPFMLTLIKTALPTLRSRSRLSVDQLYEQGVRALLRREHRRCSEAQLESHIRSCEELATEILAGTSSTPTRGIVHVDPVFHHYSYLEFFLSRYLARQITSFDANLLSTLDLVAAYNLNRILVPMLIGQLDAKCCADGNARVVSRAEYLEFLAETGWRRESGYGVHPSMIWSREGVPSTTFELDAAAAAEIHREILLPGPVVTGISWYDLAAFAAWKGARIPTTNELGSLIGTEPRTYWSATWHSEPLAHIAGLEVSTGAVHGINPDVRSPRIAGAIVFPAMS